MSAAADALLEKRIAALKSERAALDTDLAGAESGAVQESARLTTEAERIRAEQAQFSEDMSDADVVSY